MEQNYTQSSYREKLIEHLFIGELLRISWMKGKCSLEIAKPEVDYQGYDVIAEDNGIIRHIQLKAAGANAKTAVQKIHVGLSKKPSGCVVWIYFDENTMKLGPFLLFGGEPGEKLPSIDGLKIAKHTKANASGVKAERPDIREVTKGMFTKYESAEDIYVALFGQ